MTLIIAGYEGNEIFLLVTQQLRVGEKLYCQVLEKFMPSP